MGVLGMRCRGWQQEAALRMLENNLHPDVAEKPSELIVYGGIGKAARDRSSYETIRRELTRLAGLGGMGGAQPLAITMCGGTALCIEVDLHRIERRLETGYLDERAADLDDALGRLGVAAREGAPLSIGLLGNAAEVLPELVRRG